MYVVLIVSEHDPSKSLSQRSHMTYSKTQRIRVTTQLSLILKLKFSQDPYWKKRYSFTFMSYVLTICIHHTYISYIEEYRVSENNVKDRKRELGLKQKWGNTKGGRYDVE